MSSDDWRTTAYFRLKVLPAARTSPSTIARPCWRLRFAEIQPDGRWRTWGRVALPDGFGTRILRVVTLADGTLHNAFIGRGFIGRGFREEQE